jgi:hypothetical protein
MICDEYDFNDELSFLPFAGDDRSMAAKKEPQRRLNITTCLEKLQGFRSSGSKVLAKKEIPQ